MSGSATSKLNDALPKIEVDPETYVVRRTAYADCEPIVVYPIAQWYFLFKADEEGHHLSHEHIVAHPRLALRG